MASAITQCSHQNKHTIMSQPKESQLKKKLNLYGLTMIAVGACIGTGIFTTPGMVVQSVPNHLLVVSVWLLGGLIAMTGALTFSELGGMFPKAGGVYVYLKEAYGKLTAFLYGWCILLVITTGALASLGMGFAEYMTFFIDLSENGKIVLAAITIVLLTGINIVGVDVSQMLANLFTGAKLLALAAIIVIGFLFANSEASMQFSLESAPDNMIGAMLTGLVGVLFSVGGWHHISYLSGEAIHPKKDVPRAMIIGVTIVMIAYILANLAYMSLLPLNDIASTERIAGDAFNMVSIFQGAGGKVAAVIIAISIFGTISIYTMTAPRIYFAMAKDGVFFQQFTYIHPKYRTPVVAMIVQAIWTVILLFALRNFRDMIKYVVFMDFAFMTMAGAAIFIFRKKLKNRERPIRAWGYPIIPIIFVVTSTAFVINTLFSKHTKVQAIAGLIVLGIGIVAYYVFGFNKGKN